jgi:predicted GNAT superfamily acetyltransferase
LGVTVRKIQPHAAPKLEMRLLKTHEEYLEAEQIQRTVWGFADREIIPLNELVVAQKNGGHVFGAFENGRMVAFCFGVPGYLNKKVYHYSRMLGVLPEYQDKGLGYKLKLYQRELVSKQGLDLVRWTFDPLQSRNAFFNIEKLGAVIREYVVNIYGDISSSKFNAGLETDRFLPEWWIRSKRVKRHLDDKVEPVAIEEVLVGKSYAAGLEARFNEADLLVPETVRVSLSSKKVYAEVPAEIDVIKGRDLDLARRWRFELRKFFTAAFAHGYVANRFASGVIGERRRSAYLLEKGFKVS